MAERKTIKKHTAKAGRKKAVATKAGKASLPTSTKREIAFFILLLLSIFLLLGLYTDDRLIGHFGSGIHTLFLGLFGFPAYLLPLLCLAALLYILKTRNAEKSKLFVYISGGVFAFCLSALFYVFAYLRISDKFSISDIWAAGKEGIGGGLLGAALGFPLVYAAKATGATLILMALILIAFIAMTDFAVTRAIASFLRNAWRDDEDDDEDDFDAESISPENLSPLASDDRRIRRFADAASDIVPAEKKTKKNSSDDLLSLPHAVEALSHTGDFETNDAAFETPVNIFNDQEKRSTAKHTEENSEMTTHAVSSSEDTPGDEALVVKRKRMEGEIPVDISRESVVLPYTFPDTELLNKPRPSQSDTNPAALRELSIKLVETLKSFNINVKVLEISKGPAITRFELQPTAGVRVSKITSLSDDIALSLAAKSVRIEAPIPGKAAIGIEIPNASVSMVSIRDVLESREFKESKSLLSCALGRDIAGKCIVGDIAKMPHVLIAGATGSGKSVCINSLIASLLYKASPNDVKLIMIDPKVVELKVYDGIPHLLIPVVTDPRKAAGALNWAVQEMTTRYRFFADNGVRDLKGYNALMEKKGMPRLPQIVIIIDELADLMMVAPKDVESYICRLAQLARAAGMHLVIATQRPSVNVITGVIKANIPSRIAFAVSSYVDSRTILDMGGAEHLLGKGDMLFYPMGESKPTRVQGAFISDEEVERLVEFVKRDSKAVYDEDVLEHLDKVSNDGSGDSEEDAASSEADPLLPKAIELTIDAGQASVSLVQRRLSVGYSRAGRLVDQMEERGIIGPHEGSKPRRVLITKAEYLAMLQGSGLDNATSAPIDEDIPLSEDDPSNGEADADDFILPPGV